MEWGFPTDGNVFPDKKAGRQGQKNNERYNKNTNE